MRPSAEQRLGVDRNASEGETAMSIYDEAIREWVWIVGAERPDECWLLSPHDSWHRNPHYTGTYVPHPELDWEGCRWKNDASDDDIPF
jgi:hypothetical protein